MEHENEELRYRILYNSHFFIESLGEEYFIQNMYEHYLNLTKHENESLRARVAESIHKVVEALGIVGSYKNGLHKCITSFMTDKYASVQGALLVNLDQVVKILLPSEITEEHEQNEIHKKIGSFKVTFNKNFMNMEEVVKVNWRHLIRWIDCLYKVIGLFDSSIIVKRSLPTIITHLKKGGKETRRF